ncbi:hypothetical protein ACQ4M3_13285 [Leptolyngbya sp. AN03gr2]|uniref:hypothetical protein n=1 Tax=unclassified Leptolyngbya TaxID=2650499 RepID=UPI003D31C504
MHKELSEPTETASGSNSALPDSSSRTSASVSLYRFSRMVSSPGARTSESPQSVVSSPSGSSQLPRSYRFGRTQAVSTPLSEGQYSYSTSTEALPLVTPEPTSNSPTQARLVERPTKYRFSLPSREAVLTAIDFSNEKPNALQAKSLPNGILLFLILVSPFVLLLALSSLALVNRPNSATEPTTNAPTSVSQGTQFDYAPLYARAEELVNRGELKLALQLLANVPDASAQRDRISAEMVRRAQNVYPNNLELAVHIVSSVPAGTAGSEEAKRFSSEWGAQLTWMRTADYAVKQQQWEEAFQNLENLQSTPVAQTEWYKRVDQQARQQNRPFSTN